MEEFGKFAYESYCESVKTTFDNRTLPTWEQLGERQKEDGMLVIRPFRIERRRFGI